MGADSKIEWCDHTMNFWVGCTKVSPACDHCYAEGWAKRTGQSALWAGKPRRTTPDNWRKPIKWNAVVEASGARRARVFACSLADFFDNQVDPEWRADAWRLIDATRSLDWLILTKRPQNIAKMLPLYPAWNVWLGTTVENRAAANRIGYLRDSPASIRFLSCEPLIEAIEPNLTGIHWVICGGESGAGAREMDPAWARSLRDQCAAAGVKFFLKQMTKKAPIPDDLMVREFPA